MLDKLVQIPVPKRNRVAQQGQADSIPAMATEKTGNEGILRRCVMNVLKDKAQKLFRQMNHDERRKGDKSGLILLGGKERYVLCKT